MDAHIGAIASPIERSSPEDASSGDNNSRISVEVEEEESTASPPILSMGEVTLDGADAPGADASGTTLFPIAVETGISSVHFSEIVSPTTNKKKGGKTLGKAMVDHQTINPTQKDNKIEKQQIKHKKGVKRSRRRKTYFFRNPWIHKAVKKRLKQSRKRNCKEHEEMTKEQAMGQTQKLKTEKCK